MAVPLLTPIVAFVLVAVQEERPSMAVTFFFAVAVAFVVLDEQKMRKTE
jgi:hypothetical protein